MKKSFAIAASMVALLLMAGTALLHPMPTPQGQITVTINPTYYGLTASQSLPVFATVTNDGSNQGVLWSVSGASCSGSACGVLSQTTSTSTLYTAPVAGGTYTITATSVANSSAFAFAQIAVTDLGGVYTYRHNLTSAGVNSKEYMLTPSNVNSTSFGKLFSCGVDESVYASPLWVANVSIAGGIHNIVIVATQNDSVYAFDADGSNGTTCIQYWHASLLGTNYGAASGATPIPPADTGETGDIPTNIGITSTPVIDPSTNILYVESNTKENNNYFQRLHALNLSTGAENTSWPINITASVSGTGDGSSGGKLPFIPLHENQRPALALVNGSVYMEFGSHGDNSPWHGWVIGYNTSTRALSGAFATTPNSTGGGIWMAGSAPAVDSSNNLYVITSNGTYNGSTEFGDSFLKLSTSGGLALAGTTATATFTPDDQSNLDSGNVDLGQGGAITLLDSASGPNPHLLIGGGKEGVLYLLNRDKMGGYSASNNNGALQTWSLGSGGSNYAGIAAVGTFWQNTYYIAGSDGAVQAYAFNTITGLFNTNPTSQSTNSFPFPGASPEISASGTTNSILWALDTSGNGTNGQSTGPAVLYAYDATNLNTQFWNSTQKTPQGGSNQAADAVKFVVPTVANGKVYVVGVNSLTVYGLFSSYKTAAAPTFTPSPGTYISPITLSDASSGATIYYTTDGSLPTTSSNVYTGPITLAATTTITAMATAPGLGSSPPVSGTYTVGVSTVAYVQGAYATPQSSQTSIPVVFAGKQTLGDLNVVVVGWNDTTAAISSVNDSAGNTYALAVGPTALSGTLSQSIYYAKNIASAAAGTNTVTVTFTKAAAYPDIRILEYNGVDPNSPVDVAAANTGNSSLSDSGAMNTKNATDLLFGANIVTGITGGPGAGFTSRLLTSPDGDIAEDEMVTSTGSYDATAPTSGSWIMQLVAFRAAGSGSGGTVPTVGSVSPNSGPATGGTAVTITGTNFAAGATVTFGTAAATNVLVTNSTTITATTPAGSAGPVTVTVTVNGQSGNLTSAFMYVAPPTVSNVSPNSGSTGGGTGVTITGTNFAAGASVMFGSIAATNVVVVNSATITATSPAGSAGAVTVTVTNTGSQSGSLTNGFTYMVIPAVSSVSPNSGPGAGGTAVTITGTNFAAGATVTFGTAAATNVVVTNSTTITATTPAGSAGLVTVTVTVNGQSGSLTSAFTYVALPTVSSVSPNSGSTSGGTAVTITGTNFAAGATVTFGSAAATNVVVTNSTTITATTPASSVGAVTVTVTNTGSQSGSLANGYTYVVSPTVSSVSPNSGPGAGGTAVTITGTNFASGAMVKFGSAAATNVVVTNSTTITAATPAGSAGSVTVTVTVNGQSGSLANGFTYVVAPTVSSVSPNSGPTSGGTGVTITGTNFAAGATVTFAGAAATSLVVVNSTTITAKTPAGSVGAVTVTVTNTGSQSASLANGFTYVTVTTISYVQGNYANPQTSQTSVPVKFNAPQTLGDLNVVVVGWNDTTAAVSSVADSSGNTYALAVGPNAISGTLSQSIYYAKSIASAGAGANTVTVTFTTAATYADIRILEYSGADPNTPVDVTAANTGNGTTSSSASATTTNATDLIFGANIVTSITSGPGSGFTSRLLTSPDGDIAEDEMVSSTGSYSATAPLSSGAWIMQMVAFRTPSGGPVPPTVSGVSPSSGPTAGGTAVTITGTNFAAGGTVTFGSTGATNVVVVNSTTITATTPAGTAGAVKVTVTVNGQSGSLTNAFTYVVPPTVSSVSPSSGSTAGGTGVTITGTNFVAGATVTFGSSTATNVVVANSTTITATTPAGTAGAVTVTVTLSGQSGSLPSGFTYVVGPAVSSVSPATGPAAGGTAVTIKGTNFAAGATVAFGSASATNVVVTNGSTITATTPAGSAGAVTVTVTVNGVSGSLANAFTYIVPPTVSSVTPNTGPTAGGTAVTITGTNFVAGATVTFGSGSATSVVVTNSTTITATTPAGSAGGVTVTVTVNGVSGSLANAFTYIVPPTVSSVSPNNGPGTGGTAVTVAGTNFVAGATVTFGSASATNVVVTNSTTITATTPAGSAGAVTVTVTVNGVSGSLANAFTYIVPPTVSSVTPNTGSTSGGTAVTIAGTNFAAGATVTFGSAAATSVVVANSTTITATTPAGSVGAVTVTVTNTGSQSGSLASAYTYASVPTPTAPTNFTAVGGGPGPIVQAVQGYDNPTSLTSHTTAAFDSTGGDVIVICASSHAGVTLTPSDSFGNTWISIAGPTSTSVGFDLRTQVWYARNPIVGPNHTVTMTLSLAQPLVISIIVGKGSNVSSPVDAISLIGSDNGTQTVNVASPNTTTSSVNDLLIGFVKVSAGATFTSGTGFTQQPAASSSFLDAETGPAATAGTYDATFTLNASQTWQSAIAAVANNPNQTSLSWTASTETGGTISQYLVERCQGASCTNFAQIGTTAATTFNDTGLTASTSYSYRVRAQDTSGTTGPYSNTASVTTPAPAPALPGNLTATATSPTQINLSWAASAEIGGTISNYLVERCPGASCTNYAQVGTTAGTTYTDTGLAGSTSYTYRVRASDSTGHLSPYSNLAIATTASSTPTISYVQGDYATPQTSQTTVTVTFGQQQTAGDLNAVVVGWNDTTAAVSSVVDSSGNTYALAVGPTAVSGTLSQSIYYAKNIAAAAAGANTVTVTFTKAAIYADIRALEYKGADPSSPVDVTAANTGNSASSSSGAVTTTSANDLLLGANIVTSITSGPGTGFTSRLLTSPDGDIVEDEMVSSTGSYSATAPISSGAWIMQLVAFKAAP